MSDLTVDWRMMDAGRDLDRIIAERLGYYPVAIGSGYLLLNEAGEDFLEMMGMSGFSASRPEMAWREQCPRWSTDANAALPGDCAVWNISNTWYACYEVQVFENVHEWTLLATEKLVQSGQALAEARSRAWLAWKDVQRE